MRGAKPRTERECFGIGKSRGFGWREAVVSVTFLFRYNRTEKDKGNGILYPSNRLFVIFLV